VDASGFPWSNPQRTSNGKDFNHSTHKCQCKLKLFYCRCTIHKLFAHAMLTGDILRSTCRRIPDAVLSHVALRDRPTFVSRFYCDLLFRKITLLSTFVFTRFARMLFPAHFSVISRLVRPGCVTSLLVRLRIPNMASLPRLPLFPRCARIRVLQLALFLPQGLLARRAYVELNLNFSKFHAITKN